MQALYAFGLLILLAFIGSKFIVKRKNVFSPINYLFFSGIIYIFLGLFLGKSGLKILDSQVLDGLNPLISFALGWIGFLFGFQLEFKYLRRFPKKYMGLSLLQSVFVFLLTSGVIFGILPSFFPSQPGYLLLGMSVALGLLMTINSPTLLNAVSAQIPEKGSYYYIGRFLVSVSGFWGILGMGILYSFWHFPFFESMSLIKGGGLLLISILFSFLLGYLFHHLTRKKASLQNLLVYLLGIVFFTAGAAFYFNFSPLFVCMVLGITYSNMTRIQEKLYPLLFSTEKPLYIVFLILIGALWEFRFNYQVAVLVILVLLLRGIGFVFPLPLFQKVLRFPVALSPRFGLSFFSWGGLGIAFAVSLKLSYPLPLTEIFLSVSLLTVVMGEMLSPWALQTSLFHLDSQERP